MQMKDKQCTPSNRCDRRPAGRVIAVHHDSRHRVQVARDDRPIAAMRPTIASVRRPGRAPSQRLPDMRSRAAADLRAHTSILSAYARISCMPPAMSRPFQRTLHIEQNPFSNTAFSHANACFPAAISMPVRFGIF
jgi:hypothetical protein